MLWRLAVLAGWIGALVGLVALENDDGLLYIWVGPPLTVAVGWLLDRWWIVLAPAIATAVYWVVDTIADPGCSSCGYEDTRGILIVLTVMVFTAPAMAALALGVGGRRFARFIRGMDTGPDPA